MFFVGRPSQRFPASVPVVEAQKVRNGSHAKPSLRYNLTDDGAGFTLLRAGKRVWRGENVMLVRWSPHPVKGLKLRVQGFGFRVYD